MKPAKSAPALWRYNVRDAHARWLATFVLASDGYFSVVSDYGNYAFWWHSFGDNFRKFICQINADYLLSKIATRDEWDGDTALAEVKKHILAERREKKISRDEAREEWDLLGDHGSLDSESDFATWYRETKIDNAEYFFHRGYPRQAVAFCEKVMPRLVELLRAELEQEPTGKAVAS